MQAIRIASIAARESGQQQLVVAIMPAFRQGDKLLPRALQIQNHS
eukprot:SAG22_NODE_19285_length_276_cov_0.723164_1_plen_44_part_01